MSQSNLVVVQSCATEGEAEVAKGVLESSGIDAMIQADTASRMREHLAWSGLGHRVLVREEDAATARSLQNLPRRNEDFCVPCFCSVLRFSGSRDEEPFALHQTLLTHRHGFRRAGFTTQ
jgi:hypothetical protein